MLKLIAMAFGTLVVGLGAYASFEHQYGLEGRITYLVIAALIPPLLAAFLPETFVTAWRRKHKFLAFCLFVVFAGCCAQVFLAAADRMHSAMAGPAAARSAARAAVADAEQAVTDAKAKADKADADARAARKLPRAPASKKAAGSWCDDGCLKRYGDEATGTRQRVTDATNALTAARGKAVNDASLSPAVWLLPAVIDSAGIVLWALVPLLPWPRRKTEQAKVKGKGRGKRTPPKPRPTKPTAALRVGVLQTKPAAALRVGVFKPRVVA
jgi:hypothetical protein